MKIVGLIVLLTAASLKAGSNPDFKVAVHVLPHDPDRSCGDRMPQISRTDDIQTNYPGCGEIDFFPVFYNLQEYTAVEYAVTWRGPSSCVFVPCSFGHMGEIVWPGDWIAQSWDECMPGPIVIPGSTRIVVQPGQICIVPGGSENNITLCDCQYFPNRDYATASYCDGVCGASGDKPENATKPTRWGAIKRMFR